MVAQPPQGDNGAPPPAGGAAAKKAALPPAELSAEDVELRDNLLLCVHRVLDPDPGVARLALETLRAEIRTATRCAPAADLPSRLGAVCLTRCAFCARAAQLHDQRAEAPQVPAAPV